MNKICKSVLAISGFAFPLLAGTPLYAADPTITINNKSEELYVSEGIKASEDDTISYDADKNILTLDGFNGDDIQASNLENLTIVLKGDNTLSMKTLDSNIPIGIKASNIDLLITGNGNLKVDIKEDEMAGGASATIIRANSITIDTATLDLKAPTRTCMNSNNSWMSSSAAGDITINSGNIKLACKTAIQAETFTLNGGTIDTKGEFTGALFTPTTKNIIINEGELSIEATTGDYGIGFSKKVEISGGKISIHGANYGFFGIDDLSQTNKVEHFLMTGGELEIKDVDYGINMTDTNEESYIEFAGGTVAIDSILSAAEITYANKNDKNIDIASKMFIEPKNATVQLDDTIASKFKYYIASGKESVQKIIITDDKTVIEPEDKTIEPEDDKKAEPEKTPDDKKEIQPSDEKKSEAKDEKSIKIPNTGASTDDDNYLLVAISALPILAFSVIGVIYYRRSHKKIIINR